METLAETLCTWIERPMARLEMTLLGPVQIVLDGNPVPSLPYDKVRALLACVAAEPDRPHRREALAALLWPEDDERAARHSLSQALWTLRQCLPDAGDTPVLLITRDAIQLNPAHDTWVDVVELVALLDACDDHAHAGGVICRQCAARITRAAGLYRGPFLEQLALPDSVEFDEWALARRELLHQRLTRGLLRVCAYHQTRQDHDRAIAEARRLLGLDPYNEDGHRMLMRSLASSGARAAALAHFEQLCRTLSDDLATEPDVETIQLAEQLRDTSAAWAVTRDEAAREVPRSNLPLDLTPFVGREDELRQLAGLLEDPACRLITLVGPGGAGKTRLAIKAAEAGIGAFRDGVHFVALAGIESPALLPVSIADALGLALPGQSSPAEQTIARLRDREMLIVLDNVEHLLSGATFLAELLDRAPDIQVIATSRERLSLRGEWVVQVEGLALPGPNAPLEESSAVRLFTQAARRARSGFDPGPEDLEAITRICRLTGGLPLAIELAAAWLPVLSCAEIAAEVERSLDFLEATTRDIPERQRSIRGVFDHSWNLLSERERDVFCRLAVFRGGVPRSAAEATAGGSLPVLSALVAKSLMHRVASGRYEIHDLVRQYAEDRLAERSDEAVAARDRHCEWFCDFLARMEPQVSGPRQQHALEQIGAESENVRAAWLWAISRARVADVSKAAHCYWLYCEVTGRYLEMHDLFGQVIAMLRDVRDGSLRNRRERAAALGAVLIRYGSVDVRLGNYERGERSIDEGIAVLRPLGDSSDLGLALNFKATFARAREDYDQERQLLLESIEQFAAQDDRWGIGYSTNDLGMATAMLGDVAGARQAQERALEIFSEIGDRRGAGFALHNLGIVAIDMGDLGEARRRLHEALAIRRALHHYWGAAVTLTALGVVERSTGHVEDARARFHDALRQAILAQSLPAALDALSEMAVSWLDGPERDRAVDVLMLVRDHAAAGVATRRRAGRALAELGEIRRTSRWVSVDWSGLSIEEQIETILGDQPAFARA